MGTKVVYKDKLETEYVMLFDSRDSKRVGDTPWEFQIRFHDLEIGILKNVSYVEILGVAFPKITGEDYCFLSIPEFPSQFVTSDTENSHPHFMFYFDNYNLPVSEKKAAKGADFYKKVIPFQPHLSQLSQMTFKFTKHGGNITLSDLNNATPHVSLLVKVVTVEPFTDR